jgi:hypothetical protein
MKTRITILALALLAFAALPGPAAPKKKAEQAKKIKGIKGKRAPKPKDGLPDCLWYTQDLAKKFTIVSARYDKRKSLVTWVLKAKKDVKTRGYTAQVSDEDAVPGPPLRIRLRPYQARYHEGDTVKATLNFPSGGVVARVVIRENK